MENAIRHLLVHCGGMRAGERVLVVADETTASLAQAFVRCAEAAGGIAALASIPAAQSHGEEPTGVVAARMLESDLVLGLTRMSLAHTQARLAASQRGTRYLSLPGYSAELLSDPCVMADFRAQYFLTRAVTEAFTAGSTVRVATRAGTDLQLQIGGRSGNCCPGFVDEHHLLGSPPDIESNVSPLEDRSEGVIVVDGSIACNEIGLLSSPVVLTVEGGRIVDVNGEDAEVVDRVRRLFERVGDDKAYVLAECGVGLNPLAQLTGAMLTDEGALGCVHFGFGSNSTVGGMNKVSFHVDFVVRQASLWVDEQPVLLDGRPCIAGSQHA